MNLLDINFDVNQAIKDAEAALGKYGPAIYHAAQHQVAAQIALLFVWGIALTIVAAVAVATFPFTVKSEANRDSDGLLAITHATLALLALGATAIVWSNWYVTWTAPDWAALQLLKP